MGLKYNPFTGSFDFTGVAPSTLSNYVLKSGDTITGPLGSTRSDGLGFSQTRSGQSRAWGANGDGVFEIYNTNSATTQLSVYNAGIYLGTVSNPGILKGTGFPNGVVSAPVGSIYIDTAITNGASSWIKKSGTGNTGWQVLEGDTGWRNITALAPSGNVIAGSFAVRRTNNTVFIRGDNLTLNEANAVLVANATADIGSGFMPMENHEAISRISPTTYVPTIAFSVQPGSTTAGLRRFGTPNAAYSTAQWSTVRDWPTTLPGVSA